MTTVMTQDLYQAGSHYSNPLPWALGKRVISASVLLSDEDASDPANSLMLAIEASFDGGTSFSQVAKVGWQGSAPQQGQAPAMPSVLRGYSASLTPPTHVRTRLELSQPLSVGTTLIFP